MQVALTSQHELTSENARKHTGRSLDEWYQQIDEAGVQGRRAVGEFLLKQHKLDAWWTSTIVVEYEIAHGALEKDGRPKGYSICVTKNVAAPAQSVFAAFTSAPALNAWMGKGTTIDLREGGSFSNADGNRGDYLRITPAKTLKFSWNAAGQPTSIVEVKLQEKDGKSGITLNHERIASRAEADGLRTAWGDALQRLKAHLEQG